MAVNGFPPDARVRVAECPAEAADLAQAMAKQTGHFILECGPQPAQQLFVDTGPAGSGTFSFKVHDPILRVDSAPQPFPCSAGGCVLVATDGTTYITAGLGFGTAAPPTPVYPTAGTTAARSLPAGPTLATLPDCGFDHIRLLVQAQGENTGVAVAVEFISADGPCMLTTDATLTVKAAAGATFDIQGSPATATISQIAGRSAETAEVTNKFYWSNWCGPPTANPQLNVRLPWGGLDATTTPPVLPACLNPTAPSTLATIDPQP